MVVDPSDTSVTDPQGDQKDLSRGASALIEGDFAGASTLEVEGASKDKKANRQNPNDNPDDAAENTAHVITYDPRAGDNENAIGVDEIEEHVDAAQAGKPIAYYKTLAQEDSDAADQNGNDIPLDEGFTGFEDAHLIELTRWGKFRQSFNGVVDRGDYFSLMADKRGQVTDEALKQTIISLVLVKGYTDLYFYRGGKRLDPAIASKASILLSQLQQPGSPLEGRTDVRIEMNFRMQGLEPWKAHITDFDLPFMPSSVNRKFNQALDNMFGGVRASILERSDIKDKEKEALDMEKASRKSAQNTKKVGNEFKDPTTGKKLGETVDAPKTTLQLLASPREALAVMAGKFMSKMPGSVKRSARARREQTYEQVKASREAQRQHMRPQQVAAENLAATNAMNADQNGTAAVAARAMHQRETVAAADDDHLCPTKMADINGSDDSHGEETSSSGGGGGRAPEPSEAFTESADVTSEGTEARKEKAAKTGKDVGEFDAAEDNLSDVAAGTFDAEHVALDDAVEVPDVPVEQEDRHGNTSAVPGRTLGS